MDKSLSITAVIPAPDPGECCPGAACYVRDTVTRHSNSEPPADAGRCLRAIGLGGATLLVIGSVLGSGIFLTTGIMMQELPSTSLVLVAWTAGGLLAMAGGLTYAEMGSMFPRSGGLYVFLSEVPARVGLSLGMLLVISPVCGGCTVGFANYSLLVS
jgi:amino acid transporter